MRNARILCPYSRNQGQPKRFGHIIQHLVLCSTEESRLEQHEEIMNALLAVTFQQSSSKSMLYRQVLFYVTKMIY